MIKTNTIIDELRYLNYNFLENDKNGTKVEEKSFIYRIGKIPIILSAPHAVKQCRELQVKSSDYLTGPLAIYLAQKCDCSYFVRVFNDNDDPNFPLGTTLTYPNTEYLKTLKEFIQEFNQLLVVDIHGCTNKKQYDCSLWNDNYKTCDNNIIEIFNNNFSNFNFLVDNGSEYLGGQVTRQCSLVTNAFQIEVKRKIRSLKLEDYYLLKSFLDSMENSIYESYNYLNELKKMRKI